MSPTLFIPSDRLAGLFILHIEPAFGLRSIEISQLKTLISDILLCTIEAQVHHWESEPVHQFGFGSMSIGLSFPALQLLLNALGLRKLTSGLSYLLFTELADALHRRPLNLASGMVMSDLSEIHFYPHKPATENFMQANRACNQDEKSLPRKSTEMR